MTQAKTRCPICGAPMRIGRRVTLSLSWETSTAPGLDRIGRSAIVCRRCASEIALAAGLDVPEEAAL